MQISPLAKGRVLNWRPSLKGHHVKKYSSMELHSRPVMLAPLIDWRPLQSPVWDQGQTGSCSGFSSRSHLEALQLMGLRLKAPIGTNPLEWSVSQFTQISAFFHYWNTRAAEGDASSDAGATTLLDVCNQLQIKGACSEATWPSNGGSSNVTTCPPSKAYGEAYHHKLPNFYAVANNLSELKRCLSNGFGFVFGIPVYESFMGQDAASTGVIPYPSPSEGIEGGHALYCVGYDDSKQAFIFKNSWTDQWGDNGYGYLPYDYMLNLADDQFTMRLVPTAMAA
jgi:C1A family cysteine protease